MSVASWKREFYPITARSAARKGDNAALEHSIQKWRGLQPDALARHGIGAADVDHAIGIDETSCSLCRRFRYRAPMACEACPLSKVRGDTPCFAPRPEEHKSPWGAWLDYEDPAPMLAWLLLARERAAP